MKPHYHLSVLAQALALSTYAGNALAQSTSQPPIAPQQVENIVVIGNPLDTRDTAAPVSSLSGANLMLKKSSTLGETLSSLPGVSSTFFGPNASRPIIRGLDGDRIKILSNQGSSFDASNLSPDHNPGIDPLAIERVEVLRGPASLLYGGTAIGGAVNIIDNRIPRNAVVETRGALETRWGGADQEQSTSALLEIGNGRLAIHADAFTRATDDYRVPAATGVRSPVVNSAADGKGGALGASYILDKGYIGIAQSNYQSRYGTVAEETVKIDMRQNRTSLEANLRDLGGLINGLFAKYGHADYRHVEKDDGVPATTFRSKGDDFRLELKHARLNAWQGVVGLQVEQFTFSALGDEAFVPQTRTQNHAFFLFEEIKSGPQTYTLGGRLEQSRVKSAGEGDTGQSRFGAATERRYTLPNLSAGITHKLDSAWSLISTLSLSSRAPTYYELFANGPHAATSAYEVGNPNFRRERATALDLAIQWKSAAAGGRLGIFTQQFSHYLTLKRTGIDRDTEGNNAVNDCGDGTSLESACTAQILPEFAYQAVSARLRGFEAEGKWRLIEKPYSIDLEAKADYVRADDRTNRQPLPRIAPLRLTTGLIGRFHTWEARAELLSVSKQNRVARDDALGPTSGYTFLNAALTYNFQAPKLSGLLFLRGNNLTDRKAFNASSIDTIRALAPLPGRSIKAGVQLNF
ncbi:MAG: TonB-dependent receptor [Betaproteobacteria bacterium]|nr:TonB-dependent receptor [Betaproteobacteria bacterium]